MDRQDIIIYNTPDGHTAVNLYAHEGTIWLNQNQLADLFATSRANVSLHISNILKEKELREISVVKDFLTTASDGKEYR
ncbi:MAG: hydroxyacid dehydrogenase, partial [Candidatus Poribacteria bacterium]|nr:hydroxyacid dehydrogenase [Candidatus Poribacteria bacterium]